MGTSVLAEVNMPSTTPIYFPEVKEQNYNNTQNNYKKQTTPPQTGSISNQLSSLGKSAAQAALNEDDNALDRIFDEMADKGADNINIEEYENSCPYRKYLTPKTIGGVTYTNKTKCVKFSYSYNGKSYEEVACK